MTRRVRLTDPQQHREVRGDPEEEQWQQADADTACVRVGIDGDREARDEPEVPNAETQPARSDGSTRPDLDSGASRIWPQYGAVGGHATALTSVTRLSATIRPSRIRHDPLAGFAGLGVVGHLMKKSHGRPFHTREAVERPSGGEGVAGWGSISGASRANGVRG